MSLRGFIENGTSFHVEIEVTFGGQTFPITIKPIDHETYNNIESKLNKGQKRYFDPKLAKNQYLDLEDANRRGNEFHIDVLLAGIVDELTREEANKLPAGLVRKVSAEILKISGVSEEDEVKN